MFNYKNQYNFYFWKVSQIFGLFFKIYDNCFFFSLKSKAHQLYPNIHSPSPPPKETKRKEERMKHKTSLYSDLLSFGQSVRFYFGKGGEKSFIYNGADNLLLCFSISCLYLSQSSLIFPDFNSSTWLPCA